MAITITNIVATPPATSGGTGSLHFDVNVTGGSGTAGLNLNVYRAADSAGPGGMVYSSGGITPGPNVATGLQPGALTILISEVGTTVTASETVVLPVYSPPPVPGCTDPDADNYDPDATQDNGSCTYTPPPRVPFFRVPLAQSLRFVDPSDAFDGLPFADSEPADTFNPGYCQLVEQGDTLVVQYQHNYGGTNTVRLLSSGTALPISFTPTRVAQGAGTSPLLDAFARLDVASGTTRIYFNDEALPCPFLPGQRITLTGAGSLNGTYPILQVLEDPAANVPYLRIGQAYPGTTQRIDLTLTTPYALQAFDTWQAVLPFSAVSAGQWRVSIRLVDTDFGTTAITSEPMDVAAVHRDTVLVTYRNFDNAFDLNYTAGLVNRIRVRARFYDRQTPTQKTTLRSSNNTLEMLSADAQRKVQLDTYLLPGYRHEQLALAFCHDLVRVDGLRVIAEGDYDYPPVTHYALAKGTVLLEQVDFLQGNRDDIGDVDTGGPYLVADMNKYLNANP